MSQIDFRVGSLKGRLAGLVGASWKGIDYVRKMVIPYNPKSAAQTGTRTVFAKLVAMGRRINSTILKLYTVPKPKKMSPFNKFISNNQPLIDSGVYTIADVIASKGGLFTPPNWSASEGGAVTICSCSWDDDLQGEALATDKIIIIVYNETKDLYFFETSKVRSDGSVDVTITGTESGDDVHAWMFAVQGDVIASDSSYDTYTVA